MCVCGSKLSFALSSTNTDSVICVVSWELTNFKNSPTYSVRPVSDVKFSCAEPNVNELPIKQEFSSLALDSAHEKFDV